MSKRMSEKEYFCLLRHSLSLFTERVFKDLYPSVMFLGNWHIDLIAYEIEQVLASNTKRLIINVPPRSLKSIIASVSAVAWALGKEPHMEIICVSYGQELADKLAEDTRNIMMSEWYFGLFGVALKGARPPVSDFKTRDGGGRFATSIGGVLTGRGGDLIIIDDPLKPSEALSDISRNNANEWIMHTLMSRLNDKKKGAVIIIMQRLHVDDVVGHVQNLGEWKVISLPSIAESTQVFEYETLSRKEKITRYVGDVLHPEREPLDVLMQLKQSLGEYHFSGQYQQEPVPLGGGMFKTEWFQYYHPHEFPIEQGQIIQSWDTANKESEFADYSVCTTWKVYDEQYYLMEVYRARMNYPTLKHKVIQKAEQYHPDTILIEDKASGTQLIQELKNQGMFKIKEYSPKCDKTMRAHAQTGAFECGKVKLPISAPWLADYTYELTSFPKGKYDDQVDSTTQAIEWLTSEGFVAQSYLNWMAFMQEDMKRRGIPYEEFRLDQF